MSFLLYCYFFYFCHLFMSLVCNLCFSNPCSVNHFCYFNTSYLFLHPCLFPHIYSLSSLTLPSTYLLYLLNPPDLSPTISLGCSGMYAAVRAFAWSAVTLAVVAPPEPSSLAPVATWTCSQLPHPTPPHPPHSSRKTTTNHHAPIAHSDTHIYPSTGDSSTRAN